MAVIYLGNRPFPVIPNPPSGDHYLGLDTANGNHLTRQDSSGNVIDLESGATYTDAEAVQAIRNEITGAPAIGVNNISLSDVVYLRNLSSGNFFKARVVDLQRTDPDRFSQVFSDFISGAGTAVFSSFVSGTGASHQAGIYGQDVTQQALGVLQSDTGTVANGRAALGTVSNLVFRAGVARFVYESRTAIEQLSTVAQTFFLRMGLIDSFSVSGDGTNGLYFRYTDAQNGGRLQAVSRVSNADVQIVDTGFAPDLNYHIYRVELSEDGLQARFYIDNTNVAIINAPNLPSSANPFGAGFKIEKTVGTTQVNMSTDWLRILVERSSAR